MELSSCVAILLLGFFPLVAATPAALTIAAAADLAPVEPALSAAFEKIEPGVKVRFVNGASATLAQQIKAGAPFDLFLSANIDLIDGLHLDAARIYAVGHVAVLWRDGQPHELRQLEKPEIRFVALPNPKLAPYGLAAKKALEEERLWKAISGKAVYGENVRQTLQLFDSGNADVVLTALSLVKDRRPQIVPSAVVQKAGIVPKSQQAEVARRFLSWLLEADAQKILAAFGFDRP